MTRLLVDAAALSRLLHAAADHDDQEKRPMTDLNDHRDAVLTAIATVEAYRRDDRQALTALLQHRPAWMLSAVLAKELAAVLAERHGDQLPTHLSDARAMVLAEVSR